MSREIRFTATDEEYTSVYAHVSKKHRWKRVSDFARYCVFKELDLNPAGAHHAKTGNAPGRPRKAKIEKGHEKTGDKPVPRFYERSGGNVAGAAS